MMRKQNLKTRCLAYSAMLSALGVVILAVGSLAETPDLTVAALASILLIYAVIEIGGIYPWMIWAVTAFLGILLLPIKTASIFYAIIGLYPVLKEKMEKCHPRIVEYLLKLGYYHLAFGISLVLAIFVLVGDPAENTLLIWLGVYAMGLLAFGIFDFALTKIISLYLLRFRNRFKMK